MLWLNRSGRFRVLGPAGALTVDTISPSFTRYAWATGSYDTCRNNEVYTVDLSTGESAPIALPDGYDVAGSAAYFRRITDLVYTAGDGLFVRAGYTPGGIEGDYECIPTARWEVTNLLQRGDSWTSEWALQGWPITGWTSPGQVLPAPGPQPVSLGPATQTLPGTASPATPAPPSPVPSGSAPPPPPPAPPGATIYGNPCSTAETAPSCSPARVSAAPTNSASRIGDVSYGQPLTARCWGHRPDTHRRQQRRPRRRRTPVHLSSLVRRGLGAGRGYVSAVWTTKSNGTYGLPGC